VLSTKVAQVILSAGNEKLSAAVANIKLKKETK